MQHVMFQLSQTVSTIHQVSAIPHCKYVIIFIFIFIFIITITFFNSVQWIKT